MAHRRFLTHALQPSACRLGLCLVAILLDLSPQRAPAQKSVTPPSGRVSPGNQTNTTASYTPFGETPREEADLRLENLRERARATDRQKRMVDDANRLVDLTARYRAGLADHGKPTAEDERMLLEIEKLARSVKDRMRGM